MQNLMIDLLKLLKKDERLVSQDGVLLKNQTQELARKNDPVLIKLLLSDKVIKKHFLFEGTLAPQSGHPFSNIAPNQVLFLFYL